MPASTAEDRNRHLEMSRKAMQCALTIIADHVHISQRGMMTYCKLSPLIRIELNS